MQCPSCQRRLSDIAETCRCGWTKQRATESRFVHCAHETCPVCAMCRVKTATGWANLCHQHYDDFFKKRASDFCQSRGLDTRDKQIAYIKKTMGTSRLFKNAPIIREPGEDSEVEVYGETV